MKFFKNIEVSRLFGVSPTAITNWIESSKAKRNNLELIEIKDKSYILDNANNLLIMKGLSTAGKLHRRKDHTPKVEASKELYKTFLKPQITELLRSLENDHEIPDKYTYFNGGAELWKEYSEKSFNRKISNPVTNTDEMLINTLSFVTNNLPENTKVNIIDIGVGDALTVKDFLKHFVSKDQLNKYVMVDLSNEMLKIAENNIKSWFGNEINYKMYNRDISKDDLYDILFYESKDSKDIKIINIVLFLGGTMENQYNYNRTLYNLRNSLTSDSWLFLEVTLDNDQAKTYFDWILDEDEMKHKLHPQNRWLVELIGIKEKFYNVAEYYDDEDKCRKIEIILETDLDIEFNFEVFSDKKSYRKGDRILLWRHRHHSLNEIINTLSESDFKVQNLTVSKDQTQGLLVCSLE